MVTRIFALIAVIAAMLAIAGSIGFNYFGRRIATTEQASSIERRLPPTDADLAKPLESALEKVRPSTTGGSIASGAVVSGPPPPPSNKLIADRIASKLKSYPTRYNRPETLHLGDSTPVEVVITTKENQETAPLFKGLEGEVTKTAVLVADDISAQLNGPPDRLKITLRGDKMRTISSPIPVMWIWDVEPLKPGKAQVTLEVTSYIKNGKDKQPVPIRVLQDTWEVDARGLEWAKYQIERVAPIQAFLFGIGGTVVAVLAWFGFKGFGKGKPDFET
jgi:hypothetical protein